ncbi:MAG: cysteine hydrolase [Anaerolineaceae bacterium]|nr:cysteine hydrolase [Anaerolineaceae bacterium]
MEIAYSHAAIVLIEFQKQWTERGSLFNSLISNELHSRNVISKTRVLVATARAAGVTIIHAPLIVDPKNRKGWLANLTMGRTFTQGTSRAEFTPDLVENGDLIVSERTGLDPFYGSDLETLLRQHHLTQLFFAGFLTDQCAGKGVQTALKKGFDAYLIGDCSATYSAIVQNRTERHIGIRTLQSTDIIKLLSQPSPVA